MRHHLFSLLSTQVPPVPMKGVPELACPVLKSLQTLGLAVVGKGRSQPQHGEFANPPASHCRISQNPVDGRDVPSNLRSLLRCTIRSVIGCRRRRLRQLSPNRQEYVRPGYHHLPSPETPLGTMLPPGKKCLTLRIKPSVGRMRHRYNQNHRRNLQRGFSTRLFVGITASGSMFNVIRLVFTRTGVHPGSVVK